MVVCSGDWWLVCGGGGSGGGGFDAFDKRGAFDSIYEFGYLGVLDECDACDGFC